MVFRLPYSYPASSSPDVSIRSAFLSRLHHQQFSEAIRHFIGELKPEEPVIFEIVQWIKENADAYIEQSIQDNAENNLRASSSLNSLRTGNVAFSRFWIYSHHIYNKEKRKTILHLAHELDLTGFSVPGKPGIICVEGDERNVENFWLSIRSMQWKKITLVHSETFPIEGISNDLQQLRKFQKFEEKHFDPRPGKGREVHMDRGLLFQFLQQNGSGDVFPMYFGVAGKEANHDSE